MSAARTRSSGRITVKHSPQELEKEEYLLKAYENGYNIMLDRSVNIVEPPSPEILKVVPRFVWAQLRRTPDELRKGLVDKQKAKVEEVRAAIQRAEEKVTGLA